MPYVTKHFIERFLERIDSCVSINDIEMLAELFLFQIENKYHAWRLKKECDIEEWELIQEDKILRIIFNPSKKSFITIYTAIMPETRLSPLFSKN